MDVTRHFVRVGGREVHYRRAGTGPPFVLFHVSPQSSAFVLPHLLPFASRFTLIGLDTPGYGESDPLRNPAPVMADYADAVIETFDALGLNRVPVYGTHTGANIAVELARRAPERVAALVIDGLSLSTPDVAQDRRARYAPRFTPTAAGAHLAWAWQHTRDQLIFWPWYEPNKANRLRADIKHTDYLHDVVHAKMHATNYWLGYRAAFGHDSRDALKQLSTETFFVTADADVHTTVERSVADLPENVNFIDCTEETQLEAIGSVLDQVSGDDSVGPVPELAHRTAISRSYVSIGGGQRLVRRGGPNTGKPLVLLHGGMRTSALLTETLQAVAVQRPVLAIDIAGNGDSDPLAQTEGSLDLYAEDVRVVLDACEVNKFDVYGESGGAALALEVAHQASGRVGKLILDRPELPDSNLRDEMTTHIAPPIEVRWDGSHFLTAWHMLRDGALFWPWYKTETGHLRDIEPEIKPAALQAHMLAWLKGRLTYGDYVRAALEADHDTLLRTVKHPCLVIGTEGDVLEAHARKAAGALVSSTLVLHNQLRPPVPPMASFLNG